MSIILNRSCGRLLAGLAITALATGCMSNPYKWDKKTADKLESTLEQAGKENSARIPAEVNAALLPPLQMRMPEGGGAPLEGRFDLSLNNAPARSVFMGNSAWAIRSRTISRAAASALRIASGRESP